MPEHTYDLLAMRDLADGLLLSADDVSLGRVADVEITVEEDGAARLTALLAGPEALAGRVWSRLRPLARWAFRGRFEHRLPIAEVDEIGPALRLRRAAAAYRRALGDADGWVQRHILRFIPGNGGSGS